MPRIVTLQLVPVDQPHVRGQHVQELGELCNVVLPVTIGVEDKILGGRGEPTPQRAPVASIFRVRHHPQTLPKAVLEGLQYAGGVVITSVVDDNHLEIAEVPLQNSKSLANQARQGRGVIISWKEHRDTLVPLGLSPSFAHGIHPLSLAAPPSSHQKNEYPAQQRQIADIISHL